jgi:DNA invertase Pin-like site-specific DNA recombinase
MRVSTAAQAERWSLPAQLAEGKRRFLADGVEWDDRLVFWDSETGSTADRGGFQEFLAEALSGSYSRAYVHAIDRFGRSLRNNIDLKGQLEDRGVQLVSLTEGIDFSSDEGDMLFKQLSTYSEYFLKKLAREVRKGKGARVAGGFTNATRAPFGYRPVLAPDGRPLALYEPDPVNARAVRLAFQWYATGRVSYQEIADRLNAMGFRGPGRRGNNGTISLQSVRQWLTNPFYVGLVVHREWGQVWDQRRGKKVRRVVSTRTAPGKHEPLVSRDEWDAVRAVTPMRYNAGRAAHSRWEVYLLGGRHGVCSGCGEPLTAGLSGGRRYYRCTSVVRGIPCPSPQTRVRADVVEASLDGLFARLVLPDGAVTRGVQMVAGQSVTRGAQREALEEQRRRLAQVYSRPGSVMTDEDYQRKDADLLARIEALGRAHDVTDVERRLERAALLFRDVAQVWRLLDLAARRDLFQALFVSAVVDTGARRVTQVVPSADTAALFGVPVGDEFWNL